jgi:hypothetical protein
MLKYREKVPPSFQTITATLLLCLAGCIFFLHYRAALDGWFFREDSRYFSNGLFSVYDLWRAFTTPQNGMGHYRPITKLIWGVPEWLGINDAGFYHGFLIATLGLASLFLMRLSYLLFGHTLLAILAGSLFALMPVNARPIYWICAGQDTTAALFTLSAFVFRIEQWRQPGRERVFRWLCLASLILALTSREVAFAASPLLFLVDFHFKKLRRSGDVLLIYFSFCVFVFLLKPPFQRAGVRIDPSLIFSLNTLSNLWEYSLSTPWTLGDSRSNYTIYAKVASGALLLCALLAPFFHRGLLFSSLLLAAGVAPFLLINAFSIEYVFLFGAGMALLFTGVPALWLRGRGAISQAAVALASVGLILSYYSYLEDSRYIFLNNYVRRSLEVKGFISELDRVAQTLPPFRPVRINDYGSYRKSEARDSHHFIPPALDALIPNRVFLISPEVAASGEGTGLRNPSESLWSGRDATVAPAVSVVYKDGEFVREKGASLD